MRTIDPEHQDGDPLLAWANAQCAIWGGWLGGVRATGTILTTEALVRATESANAALSASAKATFTAQAGWARILAERVAGDPRSSKLVVEAAHQMYELVTACTDAKTEFVDTWLAAVRCLGPGPAASPSDPTPAPNGRRRPGSPAEPALGLAKELMPPKGELG